MRPKTPCFGRAKYPRSVLLSIVALFTSGSGAASLQEQARNPPTIQGRLLDENRTPIVGVTLRLCKSVQDAKGSSGTFFTPDATGSLGAASVKERSSSETTFFLQSANGTWVTARTQQDGRFVFDGKFAPGKYCLGADSQGSPAPSKLGSPNGEPIVFELTAKSPTADIGDVVVKR